MRSCQFVKKQWKTCLKICFKKNLLKIFLLQRFKWWEHRRLLVTQLKGSVGPCVPLRHLHPGPGSQKDCDAIRSLHSLFRTTWQNDPPALVCDGLLYLLECPSLSLSPRTLQGPTSFYPSSSTHPPARPSTLMQ